MTKLCHPTPLFVSPKRGGILQSSGFLDLKSLVALGQTAKAYAFDELSLILLIENEITRYHEVQTIEEAIAFWRRVCRNNGRLKPWLERESSDSTANSMIARDMLSDASRYEVMLAKMLRTIPTESERLQLVSERNERTGATLLHRAAVSDNPESIKIILALYPESERLKAVSLPNPDGSTVLHCAASSGNTEALKTVLLLYPESERLPAVRMPNKFGQTALHLSRGLRCLKAILSLYPESERLHAARMQDQFGGTALHYATISKDVDCIKTILSLYPESEHLRAVSVKDMHEKTVLHCAAQSGHHASIQLILSLYPETERLRAVNETCYSGTALHFAARWGNFESMETILALYPEAER